MPSTVDIAGALEAIEARLKANWTATPVITENEDAPDPWPPVDESQNPAPWVFVELIDVDATIIGFGTPGNQTVMDTGLVKMYVMVAKGTRLKKARENAVALGEIFRQQQFFKSDPTAYVRTTTPRVGRSDFVSEDGNWISVACTVPYEFYHRA